MTTIEKKYLLADGTCVDTCTAPKVISTLIWNGYFMVQGCVGKNNGNFLFDVTNTNECAMW